MGSRNQVRHEEGVFKEKFSSCDGKEFDCKTVDSRSLIITIKASRTHFSTLVCPSSDTQVPDGDNRRIVMSVCNRNHVRCIILRSCRRDGETDQQTPASLNQAKHILKEQDASTREETKTPSLIDSTRS